MSAGKPPWPLAAALLFIASGTLTSVTRAADTDSRPLPDLTGRADEPEESHLKGLLSDVKAYYTAPLHWDGESWTYFGLALGAVAVAHHFDSDVRSHFVQASAITPSSKDPNELSDALPTGALLVGALALEGFSDGSDFRVTRSMLEAGTLATATGFALKFAAGRERPSQTTDPNRWREGGSSFPSLHVTAGFALGTVFAESGEGGYRWITRALGYGLASFTGYQRLKHNGHWLSDVVAGAALGTATGVFVVDRTYHLGPYRPTVAVVPMQGGLMLTYSRQLP